MWSWVVHLLVASLRLRVEMQAAYLAQKGSEAAFDWQFDLLFDFELVVDQMVLAAKEYWCSFPVVLQMVLAEEE